MVTRVGSMHFQSILFILGNWSIHQSKPCYLSLETNREAREAGSSRGEKRQLLDGREVWTWFAKENPKDATLRNTSSHVRTGGTAEKTTVGHHYAQGTPTCGG